MIDNNKHSNELSDDLRPEYDAALLQELLRSGVRGKYVERFREGSNVVKLAPDVAAAFPNEQAVNDALRGLLEAAALDK